MNEFNAAARAALDEMKEDELYKLYYSASERALNWASGIFMRISIRLMRH